MSTINSVIARVDAVKLNTYTAEEKARWLIELDGRIFREIMRGFGSFPPEVYPDDAEKELLCASPYDVLYDYYLFAMIDFHNRETENYNNSYAMFNDKYSDFAKAWQRAHRPPDSGGFDVMGTGTGGAEPRPCNVIDEEINNHDMSEGAHPFLINIIKQRYDALTTLLEQYRALADGAATDADISAAVAEHQNSAFAHQSLFDNISGEIDAVLSAHNESSDAHYELFGSVGEKLNGKVDKEDGKGLSSNDFTDEWKESVNNAFNEAIWAQSFIDTHVLDKMNPHGVTAEQIGALTSDSLNDEMGKYIPPLENDIGALQNDMETVQARLGGIEAALDGITAHLEADVLYLTKGDLA